jgi:hypothetical protein
VIIHTRCKLGRCEVFGTAAFAAPLPLRVTVPSDGQREIVALRVESVYKCRQSQQPTTTGAASCRYRTDLGEACFSPSC